MTDDAAAQALFLASLPAGPGGQLIPGHTTWDQLGPQAQARYRRMAQAAKNAYETRRDAFVDAD